MERVEGESIEPEDEQDDINTNLFCVGILRRWQKRQLGTGDTILNFLLQ